MGFASNRSKGMGTTQLFVELLVIGLGALIWVSLIADIIAGGQIRFGNLWMDKGLLPLVAAAYALGVVLDRLVWSMFSPMERSCERECLQPLSEPRWRLERAVAKADEASAKELNYNRSRLRVCRAWTVNGALITIAFVVWGEMEHKLTHAQSVAAGLGGTVFVVCSFWALRKLMIDYYRNLRGSYELLGLSHSNASAVSTSAASLKPDEHGS